MKVNRLEQLEENISNLSAFQRNHSKDDVLTNRTLEWSLRYGLFETIQITIDLACHVAARHNFGSTKSYRECIESLCTFHVLDEELCIRLKRIVGLRNILIHEYVKVDVGQLYAYLNNLEDFRGFAERIGDYVES